MSKIQPLSTTIQEMDLESDFSEPEEEVPPQPIQPAQKKQKIDKKVCDYFYIN